MTAIILAVFISFYFLFYVASNDSDIRERNFRVLNRTVKNIKERAVDYQKYFESITSVIYDSLPAYLESDDSLAIARIENDITSKADVFDPKDSDISKNYKPIRLSQ